MQGGRRTSLQTPFTRKEGGLAGSSVPMGSALAGDRESGGSVELPSWEVLWLVCEPSGDFELPSWEGLWQVTEPSGGVELPSWEVLWLDREPGGNFQHEVLWLVTASLARSIELPSWEVLWLDREPGGSFELPSWEVLWLVTASLARTGCDDSDLWRRASNREGICSGEYLLIIFDASSLSVSPGSAYARPCSVVSCLGASFVAAAMALGLFRGGWCDVSLSAEWRPTLGMKGLERVCSADFGEGAIIVGVLAVFSSWPAGPGQEAGTRFSFAVLALDLAIQASVAATIAGWSLPCTFSHFELQVWRQWNLPQTSTDPTFRTRPVNFLTFTQSENDVRARLG
jgi:hypothetical protein